jgi:hypothetical protein
VSPPNSPGQAQHSLPLENESPAFQPQEDFSTSPAFASTLHTLIPALGVSSQPAIGTQIFSPQQTQDSSLETISNQSSLPPVTNPSLSPTQASNAAGNGSRTIARSHQTLGNGNSYPPSNLATSPPSDLRRQAVAAASGRAGFTDQTKPILQGRSHEPSPLGRYYLSSSDPQHISKHPQGSISFPGVAMPSSPSHGSLPGHITSPAMRTLGEKNSPTLSLASDDTLMVGDDFPEANFGSSNTDNLALFPTTPSHGSSSRRLSQARVISGAQQTSLPHQIPLPPSPHIAQSPSSPLIHTMQGSGLRSMGLGFGGTGGQLGSGRVPPSPSQIQRQAQFDENPHRGHGLLERPRPRQTTAESFVSTSSEEEDVSSPMVLPDTSLRASDRSENSPRSALSGDFNSGPMGGTNSKSLFPALSQVQRLGKMANSPFAFGAVNNKTAGPSDLTKFSFQPTKDAPLFPPMSPSSSSSADSEDEVIAHGTSKFKFAGPVSPKKKVRYADDYTGNAPPDDGGDYGHGYGGGKDQRNNDERDGSRAGSIIVGGRGYGDGSYNSSPRRTGGNGDSSDDEDKPKQGGRTDKKLDNASSRPRARKDRADSKSRRKSGDGKDAADDAGEEAETEDDGNRTATTFPESTDSEESASEYEGNATEPKVRGRKRKGVKPELPSNTGDGRSETSSGSRPDFMPSKAKRRKAGPAEEGDVHCDYVEPLPVSILSVSTKRACTADKHGFQALRTLHFAFPSDIRSRSSFGDHSCPQ